MRIKEAQEKIKKLLGEMEHPRLAAFIGLTEEVGELADEVMKKEIYEDKSDLENFKKELADILVSLLELANVYDVDLETELEKKIKDIEPRAAEWKTKFGPTLKKKREKLN